jgi:hypothetical protein
MRFLDFSHQFDVGTYQRVGLRYVNHIQLPADEPVRALRRYVKALVDFERIDVDAIEQFMTEFRLKAGAHKLMLRGALIPVPASTQHMLTTHMLNDTHAIHSRPRLLFSWREKRRLSFRYA